MTTEGTKNMQESCIFCKIVNRQIPSNVIAQTDDIIVIQDIVPKSPTHYLIIPKKHIKDVAHLQESDKDLAGSILLMAKKLSDDFKLPAFRLISNTGSEVGQSVFHVHFHFLAGKRFADF